MRSDNLKKHMKKHEGENEDNIVTNDGLDGKTEDNIVTKGVHDGETEDNIVTKDVLDGKTEDNILTNEEQISCTDEELENEVININKEFNRKIELGRKLNKIVNKHGFNENIFECENDKKVALKTYKLYGKNMDMKDIEWRGWQRDLRQYLDKPFDRRVMLVL